MKKRIWLRAIVCALILAVGIAPAALADLSRGDRGDDVAAVQEKLTALGYLDDIVDGIFGGKTKAAVEAFQQAMGLAVTGIVDDATQSLIDSAAQPTEAPTATPEPQPVSEVILEPVEPEEAEATLEPEPEKSELTVVQGCGWVSDEESPLYALGRNAAGDEVGYGVSLSITGAQLSLSGVSWTDEVVDAGSDLLAGWEAVQGGATAVVSSTYFEPSASGGARSTYALNILLPDDAAIAGVQTLSLSLDGEPADVRVSLNYAGGYADGGGWVVAAAQ